MDPKQKLTLIIAGALCGLVIVALAALLVMQVGAMNEAKAARTAAENTIDSQNGVKPYPSAANRDIRVADGEAADAWADKARALLTHGLDYPRGETPSQFVSRIGQTVRELNDRQPQLVVAGQQQVMDYSFGSYVVQGTMPAEANVPRLAAQFAVIEYVCDLLLDNGAVSITAVERETFDAAAAKPAEETRTTSRRRRRSSDEDEEAKPVLGGALDPVLAKDGVTRETYAIRFTAPYATVAKSLNALTTNALFVVVTDLSARTPVSLAARVDELTKKRQSARTNASRRAAAQAQGKPAADEALFATATPAERLVSDPERATPLEVTLRFDVYSAAPEPEPAPTAPEKEGK